MYQVIQQLNEVLSFVKDVFSPLLIAAAILLPLENFFSINVGNNVRKKNSVVDILFLLSNSLVADIPFSTGTWIAAELLLAALANNKNALNGFGILVQLPIWLQFISIAVIHDFINYWIHYSLHHTRLWKIHVVHHSSEKLNFMSALRTHFVELSIQLSLRTMLLLLLGFSLSMVLTYEAVFGFIGLMIHSNIRLSFGPLKYIFVSPVFHHWHHATDKQAQNKNFGLVFSVWDYLFNTQYCPEKIPREYGIAEKLDLNFMELFFHPFKKAKRY